MAQRKTSYSFIFFAEKNFEPSSLCGLKEFVKRKVDYFICQVIFFGQLLEKI